MLHKEYLIINNTFIVHILYMITPINNKLKLYTDYLFTQTTTIHITFSVAIIVRDRTPLV